ncbi:unnamed protein product [Periconia digitata]|uniref:Uncharacterized protein n=1 Tax=Periconia digitata TaxID=1303443 RepID=A0A9W4U7J0_9PLEO|nr:unnamed protein product [Periconia digitata]
MSRDGARSPPDWVDANFALFVLTDVSNEELNEILQKAFDGSTVNSYMFWLASDTFPTAPRRIQKDGTTFFENATKPPIPKDWTSPFIGKTVEDVASFLKTVPRDLCVDWHHFAVLGEEYKEKGLVALYRIGDEDLVGSNLEKLSCSVAGSTLALSSLEKHVWDEWRVDFGQDEPVM